MRRSSLVATIASAMLIAAGATAALPALAQTYAGAPLPDAALQARIVDAVAARLLDVPSAEVADLVPSLARGGHGYCGTVKPTSAAPAQPFHVIVDQDGSIAVLILPENGDPPGLSRADAMRLLTNLGCLR